MSTEKEIKDAAKPIISKNVKIIALVIGKEGSVKEGEAVTGDKSSVIKADTKDDPKKLAEKIITEGLKGLPYHPYIPM